MLGTFLDKATGILSQQFLIAYWFPLFMTLNIAVLIRVYVYGLKFSFDWLEINWMFRDLGGGVYAYIWLMVAYLTIIAVLAYLLQPFTRLIIRFYEGNWPLALQKWFTNLPIFGEKNIEKRMDKTEDDDLQSALFYKYPREEDRIMPTGMGNVLRAAEDYSKTVYGMDSVFWWPRLWFLLPDLVREEVNGSLIPIVALLNFTSLIVIEAILGSAYLKYEGFSWQAWLVLLAGLVLLSFFSYLAAVKQAMVYGNKIRAAIDLYRFDLLKAMHQRLPETLDEEVELWNKLTRWAYTYDRGAVANMEYKHN